MKRDTVEQSHERYQAFLQNSQEGIWRVELNRPVSVKLPPKVQLRHMFTEAILAEANLALAKMYGFRSVKRFIGRPLSELLQGDIAVAGMLERFVRNGYKLSGVESHEKDRFGRDRYFRHSFVGVVEDGHLVRAWGTRQDITEQHEAMLAQQKSEARLKMALASARMGIWEYDITTNQVMWSRELKHIYGLKADEKIDFDKYVSLLHPNDRKRILKIIGNAMRTGEDYYIEHSIVHPDGSEHHITASGRCFVEDGKVSYMMGTAMLVDERRQAEDMLRESEERFRTMADTAPVLIWISDKNTACTYFNKTWLDYTGRTFNQEVGNGWEASISPDDLRACKQRFVQAHKTKRPFVSEYRLRRRDGVFRHVLDSGVPRFSPHGEFLGFIGSCIDIEDVKDATRRSTELEVTNAELIKLADAKDEFISIASHQLRTPATGVKQYIGMLLDGLAGDLNEEQSEMLQMAYDSNERQINIINDLLKVANVDAGKVVLASRQCDIRELVTEVLKEQESKFRARKQRLVFNCPDTMPALTVDIRLMRMVLENLIDNASKYSPELARIEVRIKADTKQAVIIVKDSGIGIDKKDVDRLFQKFSRIHNHLTAGIEGTGLGLYWSKKIIDLHGGTIRLRSSIGKGTTITINLPLRSKQRVM